MHSFCELIERSTSFTLYSLEQAETEVIELLQTSSATVYIKQLQMLQLQRSIFAVDMFSIFEAHLQNGLSCQNGFKEVRTILDAAGKLELKERFDNYYLAINALKHGDGASILVRALQTSRGGSRRSGQVLRNNHADIGVDEPGGFVGNMEPRGHQQSSIF